jgi:hypothetical protein
MTILRSDEYRDSAVPLVEALGFSDEDYRRAGGLSVIRCTIMDPFLGGSRGRTDHVQGLIRAVREAGENEL